MTGLPLVLLSGGLAVFAVVLLGRYLDALAWRRELLAFSLRLPARLESADVANWLASLAAATHAPRWALLSPPPLVLEVVATKTGISHLLLVPRSMRGAVLSGLRAALPGARLSEEPAYLTRRHYYRIAAEAVLTSRRRPLAVARGEATTRAVLAGMQPLQGAETVVVQFILIGAGTPRPVPSISGGRLRTELPRWLAGEELADSEAVRAARSKQAEPLLHGSLRVGIVAADKARSLSLFGRVWGALRGLNSPGVLLVRRWWLWPAWVGWRLSRRATPLLEWPLLLGATEAAGLLPLPLGDVALPGLVVGAARQLPPPANLPSRGTQFAVSNYPGLRRPLCLTARDRLLHLHIIGPTGVGKSTLLANLILQDIAAGAGVVVIDPKGDLCVDLLARLPEKRWGDVIVLDPAATDRPLGSNILQAAHDEQSRELVVDHVIHIWHELYREFWGPRTEDVMRAALLTLINTRGADGSAFTLVEVPELLTNAAFRRFVVRQSTVPAGLDSFWRWYEAADRLTVIGPVLNKLRGVTLRSPIRLMLGQSQGLDLARVITERQVLLVPLSKGTLGAETASLVGTLQLAALWQAILGRVRLPAAQRRPVYVYIDEAQDVLRLPVDMADMLAQARGLGASFTLAHQHLGQLENRQIKTALLGTVRSQIVFQCQRDDAVALAHGFAPRLTADDLMGLEAYELAVRPCVGGRTSTPVTGTTLPLPEPTGDAQLLAERSRARFGRPRADVEAALQARIQLPQQTGGTDSDGTPRFGRSRRPSGSTT